MLAAIRGDAAEAAAFAEASALVRARGISSDAALGPLVAGPPAGAGADALRLLRYMLDAGAWVLFESAVADLPVDLRWLFESGAVTIEQLSALHGGLGILSAADLIEELHRGRIREVPGLDAQAEAAIAAALPTLRAFIPKIPLGRAMNIAQEAIRLLTDVPGVDWAMPAGSLRRGQDMIGDIEILAAAADADAALAAIAGGMDVDRYLHRGPGRAYVLIDRVQVGIRCETPDRAGARLLQLTGNAQHLASLRELASDRGWRLSSDGLEDGGRYVSDSEAAIYSALELPFIPPEIREGAGELEAARRGALPDLVTRGHIRGDLHMHSEWSDGRDSVEAMVQAAIPLGYEYIAITDHSPCSAATRTLTVDGVLRQADEIAALRARYPQIAILHGCEVDILPDGTLDFADPVLERFDVVLASLHDAAGQDRDRLMHRYETAMRHPLVSIITHPTNRLVPHRRGYDLDYDRLFDVAAATRTALEIDGSPSHLDLDGALARRAVSAGVTVVIDSDSHRAELLGRQMDLGLMMARRGWVEPRHVLNARPLADLRAAVAAKRSR